MRQGLAIVALVVVCASASELRAQRDTVVREVGPSRHKAGVAVKSLTIGSETDDRYLFSSINAVRPLRDGSVLVLDGALQNKPLVRQYSAKGEYVRQWGRWGSGPGEYKSGNALVQLPDGRVAIRDMANGRIGFYRENGQPAGSIPLEGWSSYPGNGTDGLEVDATGTLWVPFYSRRLTRAEANAAKFRPVSYARISATGRVLDTVDAPYPDLPRQRSVKVNISGGYMFLPVPNAPRSDWAIHRDGYLIGIVNTRYAIDMHVPPASRGDSLPGRWTASDPIISLRKPEAFPRLSRAELDTLRAQFQNRLDQLEGKVAGLVVFEPQVPPLGSGRVFTGSDGSIWVSIAPTSPSEKSKRFDVFDAKLNYVGRATGLPSDDLAVVSVDEVWTVIYSDGGPAIARYRVTWRP